MSRFHILAAILVSTWIISCAPQQTEDQKFESLAHNYIEQLLHMKPELATALGDHRFDSRVSDYSAAGIQADRVFNNAYLDSLSRINIASLSPVNTTDLKIMKTNLQAAIFQIDTLREYEWNPLAYNPGNAIYGLLAREFAPIKDRLLSAKERLKAIPSILAAAKTNLKNPPKIHTETAIRQNPGTIGLVRDEISMHLEKAPELKEELAPIQAEAVKALEEYGQWLEKELLPNSTGDFRLGDEKYRRKLYFSLEADLTKEQVLEAGTADLVATQNAMYETAIPLFKKFFPTVTDAGKLADKKAVIKSVLDRLGDSHPTNETIVNLANEYLKSTTDFTAEKGLITVPSEPVKIIVMPEFQRGVAVAYCDSPGPLEKNGETFYAISPTPSDWDAKRVESFYREYNNYMLQNLTIHEAVPGHYLQLAHSNKFKAPTMIRAIFGSGTFVEGWATYAEQLMVENGYGGHEVRMQQLKMRLRLIINSMIDQKIHTAGMTEQEAMAMMKNEGFQEEGEAAGKWRRACLTSAQLSTYYVGNQEINGLVKAYKAKHPGDNTKTMHDALLSVGSPAPRYVKEALGL